VRHDHADRNVLGPLERQVLDVLWRRETSVTVRDVMTAFPDLAYTTVMTTLDRLYRKGLLVRDRRGRAFTYAPRWSREEMLAQWTGADMVKLLPDTGASRPFLKMFIEAISRRDVALLDELESLIRAHRRRKENERA
jgi:predicted transcriptional regulator